MLDNQILPKLNYISTIIYYVHCNDDYPEYQNIYISDMSRNKAMIYHDGKWTSADKVSTMDNLFNSIVNCVDTIVDSSSNPESFSNYITEIKKVNPFGKLYTKNNTKRNNTKVIPLTNGRTYVELKYSPKPNIKHTNNAP